MEKKYHIMKTIMIILVIILVSLIGFLLYDQLYDNNNNESQKESNIKNSGSNNIVDNKKIIYDANYKYDVDVTSYSTSHDTYYIEDIKVPYIDIDSEDVKKINNEIKNIFNDAVNNFKKGVVDKMTYVDDCTYKYFTDDNILSVIITYGVGATDVVYPKYYTYNIDLKTGNLMSYKDVYTYLGLSDIDNNVKNAITNVMKGKLSNIGEQFDTYNNQSFDNYYETLNNGTLKYFVDSNKKMNIVVSLSIPAGRGSIDQIISL